MNIENIRVKSFGALQNLELEGLSSGLNVVVGANGAGKSTLVECIKRVCFGYRRYYFQPKGAEPDVTIEFDSGAKVRRVGREREGDLGEGWVGLNLFENVYLNDLKSSLESQQTGILAPEFINQSGQIQATFERLAKASASLSRPRAESVIGYLEMELEKISRQIDRADAELKTLPQLETNAIMRGIDGPRVPWELDDTLRALAGVVERIAESDGDMVEHLEKFAALRADAAALEEEMNALDREKIELDAKIDRIRRSSDLAYFKFGEAIVGAELQEHREELLVLETARELLSCALDAADNEPSQHDWISRLLYRLEVARGYTKKGKRGLFLVDSLLDLLDDQNLEDVVGRLSDAAKDLQVLVLTSQSRTLEAFRSEENLKVFELP